MCDRGVRDLLSTVFNAIYLASVAIEHRTHVLQGFTLRAKISLHSARLAALLALSFLELFIEPVIDASYLTLHGRNCTQHTAF